MSDPNGGEQRVLLELKNVSTHYGLVSVLRNVDMQIYEGEMVCLLGGNASGKTTTLKTILGYVKPSEGEVRLDGEVISGLNTTEVVRRGISMVPENRRLFGDMSVSENLDLGAYQRTDADGIRRDREQILETFPRIRERLKQKAGTLSGGEQQMLAIGRALTGHPTLLLLDEPSMGLAPLAVERIFEALAKLNQEGLTMLMVEQNAEMALSLAHNAVVLQTGNVTLSGTATLLRQDDRVRASYLGGQG